MNSNLTNSMDVGSHSANRKKRVTWLEYCTRYTAANLDKSAYWNISLRSMMITILFCATMFVTSLVFTSPAHYLCFTTFKMAFLEQDFSYEQGNSKYTLKFADIRTVGQLVAYISTVVFDCFYISEFAEEDKDTINEEILNSMLLQNRMIGLARLRQIQASNTSCKVHSLFRDKVRTCFGKTEPRKRFKGNINKIEALPFKYKETTRSPPYEGYGETFLDGGYVVNLASRKEAPRMILDFLVDKMWISGGTKFLSINFAYYNGNFDVYCLCGLYFEFPRAGGIYPFYYFETVQAPREHILRGWILFSIVIIFLIYFLFEILGNLIVLKFGVLAHFWIMLDIFHWIVGVKAIVARFIYMQEANYMFDQEVDDDKYVNFEYTRYYYTIYRNWYSFFLFLSYWKIWKFLDVTRTMRRLLITLRNCQADLLNFLIMFLVLFFAFSEVAYLLFGNSIVDYRTIFCTMFSLLRAVTTDLDYYLLRKSQPQLAPLFVVAYVFFLFFVILNIFMAIINESFADVKTEMELAPNEIEMTDHLKNIMMRCTGKKLVKNATKSETGSTIKPEKIQALLLDCGYTMEECDYFLTNYLANRSNLDINLDQLRADVDGTSNEAESTYKGPKPITAVEFFRHQERIENIDNSLENLKDEVSKLLKALEEQRYVKKKPRRQMQI